MIPPPPPPPPDQSYSPPVPPEPPPPTKVTSSQYTPLGTVKVPLLVYFAQFGFDTGGFGVESLTTVNERGLFVPVIDDLEKELSITLTPRLTLVIF
jgi:hypothetical protein